MMEIDDDVDPRRTRSRNSNDERADDDQERRDGGGRDDDGMEEDDHQGYQAVRPWFLPGWMGGGGAPNLTSPGDHQQWQQRGGARSGSPKDNQGFVMDEREEDVATMQRESGDQNSHKHYDSRTHEPLKRYTGEEGQGDDRGIKRRRLGEHAAMGYFNYVIPAMPERAQAGIEYLAPSFFTPLFKVLGYTPFAVRWVMFMYVCHFVQTALSTFGPETKSVCIKPWITPLVHHLMDTYIWNHTMITFMLLDPDRFGNTAYWMACFLVMGQQHLYLACSLKTHYVNNKDSLDHITKYPARQRQLELRFFYIFVAYAFADALFIASKLLNIPVLLWIGLVEFNIAPLYLVWAHKQRMDAAGLNAKKKN